MWSEEYQAELLKSYIEGVRGLEWVVGVHVWNFADFRTPQSPGRTVLNRKGVFTRDRQPKLAAHLIKDVFSRLPSWAQSLGRG
jgi:beta-glucuronidase